MVERARRRFRKAIVAGRLTVVEGSAESLPLPAASVDKACSVNSLYFWADPAAGARRIRARASPGRAAGARLPERRAESAPGRAIAMASRRYDEAEVTGWLRAAGFTPGASAFGA